jgi:DNA processing protein
MTLTPNLLNVDKNILALLVHKFTLSIKHLEIILEKYPDLKTAMEDGFKDLVIPPMYEKFKKKVEKWNSEKFLSEVVGFENDLKSNEIFVLSILDPEYPQGFKDLPRPPIVMYYQGELGLLSPQATRLTVVGSREIQDYARSILPPLITPLFQNNVVTVSGLALGVDTFVHELSVKYNTPTIGIIGSGLDKESFYPQSNLNLKSKILSGGGLIMSEFFIGTKPNRFTFPSRNRLLAALGNVTLIAQASVKSGTLITAQEALDQNKILATLPADLTNLAYNGNIALIKRGFVKVICDSRDLQDLLGFTLFSEDVNSLENLKILEENLSTPPTISFQNPDEESIYKILTLSPQSIEILAEKSSFSPQKVSQILTMLELENLVNSLGENTWVKTVF